jgi:glyoxalase/bleomycin resistance protein/dioxygenase superfamily protein
MKNSMLGTSVIAQVGLLVNDVESSAQVFADFLGVEKPPIKMTGTREEADTQYKGQPSEARAKLAFFDVGPGLQLELIEPDQEPSTWRDDLNRKGEGFHHIAFVVEDMQGQKTRLSAAGMNTLQTGEYTGGRYAYVDATDKLKLVLELLENDK